MKRQACMKVWTKLLECSQYLIDHGVNRSLKCTKRCLFCASLDVPPADAHWKQSSIFVRMLYSVGISSET